MQVSVCVYSSLSMHAPENVLDHFRDQFISVVDGLGDGCMYVCALEVGLSCLCSCLPSPDQHQILCAHSCSSTLPSLLS